ncbi:MAG: hypothetical protein BJ554DRAFT_6632, partial [Olpidium bornovanus]
SSVPRANPAAAPCIEPKITVCLGAPKAGLTDRNATGEVYLADVGIPCCVWKQVGVRNWSPAVFGSEYVVGLDKGGPGKVCDVCLGPAEAPVVGVAVVVVRATLSVFFCTTPSRQSRIREHARTSTQAHTYSHARDVKHSVGWPVGKILTGKKKKKKKRGRAPSVSRYLSPSDPFLGF